MARTYRPTQRRLAFTLVELLVAMALILFIMVILSEAFVAGLGSFRELKAVGDLEEKLRTATMILRRDLAADHFEGRRRLSDPNFWLTGQPREGFFYIHQQNPSVPEGQDSDGNPSYRATDHALWFSVKLRGNNQDRFFAANVPNNSPLVPYSPGGGQNGAYIPTNFFGQLSDGNFQDKPSPTASSSTYNSAWGEICYVLDLRNPTFAGSTPLYPLYRTQLAVVPDTRNVNNPKQGIQVGQMSSYLEMSCSPSSNIILFHNPTDLALNARALNPTPNNIQNGQDPSNPMNRQGNGTILLLTDVISFDVRVLKYMWRQSSQATDFSDLGPANATDQTFETSVNPPGQNSKLPPDYCISALEITIRVWDPKTEQARQVTIIQDM
jgi:type II secretory pathway pseudopilin PulG